MPKMKTKSGVKKRFRVNAAGKIKFKQSNTRHRLMSRPNSMKRKARGTEIMNESDADLVRTYMPYARKKKNKTTKTEQKEG